MWKKSRPKKKKKNSVLKRVVITACLGLGVTFGAIYTQAIEGQLPVIYHVYVNGQHIGAVNDKTVVQSYINQKVDSAEKNYPDVPLTVGQDISFVPETVFRPSYDNQKVLDVLKNELSIKVDAVKMEVDGQLIGYLESKEAAQQALNKIKEQYVSKDVMDLVSDPMYNVKSSDLNPGQSKVLDVSFAEKVSLTEEKVNPTDILTVTQAIKLLEKGTLADKIHEVQQGEVLGQVAEDFNLSLDDVLKLNPNIKEDSIIHIGDKINVTDYEPYLKVKVTEEKLAEETIDYDIDVKYSDTMYKGDAKVEQQGQEGKKEVEYKLTKENGKVVKKEVLSSKVIKEPVKKIVVKGTKVIPSRGTGDFTWPTSSHSVITSYYGWRKLDGRAAHFHKGIDISGVTNRNIYAADNGVVEFAGWSSGGYGNKIIINHRNGYKTLYGHLAHINVKPGQVVHKDTVIGIMGTTGDSTGIHLHFEIRKNGSTVNPLSYVNR